MTNKTRALGYRLLGSLKNESIVVSTSASTKLVSLVNAKTGKAFAAVYENDYGYVLHTQEGSHEHTYAGLVSAIKHLPTYPTPKTRARLDARPRVHAAPRHMGVSMGHFVPGNLSAIEGF